jgi:hypothetical protein
MPGRSGGAYERRTLRPGIARDALRSRGAADASGSFRTDQSRALRAGRPSQALRADRTDWSHWASQTSHAGALCARFTGGALRASGTNWANCPCGTNLNLPRYCPVRLRRQPVLARLPRQRDLAGPPDPRSRNQGRPSRRQDPPRLKGLQGLAGRADRPG